jgi:hypothetical protein
MDWTKRLALQTGERGWQHIGDAIEPCTSSTMCVYLAVPVTRLSRPLGRDIHVHVGPLHMPAGYELALSFSRSCSVSYPSARSARSARLQYCRCLVPAFSLF